MYVIKALLELDAWQPPGLAQGIAPHKPRMREQFRPSAASKSRLACGCQNTVWPGAAMSRRSIT